MDYQAIIETLGFAAGNERLVRITTLAGQVLIGLPTSLDAGRGASEVFLRPADDPDTEVAMALGQIQAVSLV